MFFNDEKTMKRYPSCNSYPDKISALKPCEISIFGPMSYTPNYAYPLIVWLHSDDKTECELPQIMPMLSLRNYVGVAPRGYQQFCKTADGESIAWPLTQTRGIGDCVLHAIRKVRINYNINDRRVYVAGRLSAGTMALWLAMSYPDVFAGAASLDGPLPAIPNMDSYFRVQRLQNYFLGVTLDENVDLQENLYGDFARMDQAGLAVSLYNYTPSQFRPRNEALLRGMLADVDRWVMSIINSRYTEPIYTV